MKPHKKWETKGSEIKWINHDDDLDFPKNPDNEYVLIEGPRGLGPDTIIGVEMEKADVIINDVKDWMMDEGESVTEEEGFVLKINFIGLTDISKIEGLENLTELQSLDLFGNEIFEIKGLEKLINLEYLDLNGSEITEIKGLENLKNLKGLILKANNINEIRGLENLVNLLYLDLSENPISEIKGLENLVNLKYLILDDIEIGEESLILIAEEDIPEELKQEIEENTLFYSYNSIPNFAQKFVEYCKRKKAKSDREDKEKIKKIEKILLESGSMSLDSLRDTLKMDAHTFSNKILEWAVEYGFEIDGDYLLTNKNTVLDFIDELDKYFTLWDEESSIKNKKKK